MNDEAVHEDFRRVPLGAGSKGKGGRPCCSPNCAASKHPAPAPSAYPATPVLGLGLGLRHWFGLRTRQIVGGT